MLEQKKTILHLARAHLPGSASLTTHICIATLRCDAIDADHTMGINVRAALADAKAMGMPTLDLDWFSGEQTATPSSNAVLTPAQVAAVAPLVRVTAAYIVMYYAFCFFQSWSKLYLRRTLAPGADGKKQSLVQLKYGGYGSRATRGLRLLGDRTFLNTVEQAPPFLVALWACGLLADVEVAALCGKCYIFFRCLYPFCFGKSVPLMLLSTVPCYNLIWYMLWRAVVACA